MKISISNSKPVILKYSPNWYRIVVKTDEWGTDIEVIDIFRDRPKDWWRVLYADVEITGTRADKNTTSHGNEFKKLGTAKLWAFDYADYIKSGTKKP